jgi:hypothetical protein
MRQYLSSSELCRLTGLPMGTLKRLRAAGFVEAAQPGTRGRGHADLWSLPQVLAIAVARGLRTRGISLEQAGQVLKYFWRMPTTRLESQLQQGQTCLLLAGTQVLPRLLTLESILANDEIDYATAATAGLLPAAVDVQRIWERIKAEVAKIAAPRQSKRRSRHAASAD